MHEMTFVKDLGVLMATGKYDKSERTKESKKKHKSPWHTNYPVEQQNNFLSLLMLVSAR
jgi:hypothetical protein